MKSIRERLKDAVKNNPADDKSLRTLLDELQAASDEKQKKMSAIRSKLKELLSPLQQAKLAMKFGMDGEGWGGKGGKGGKGNKEHEHGRGHGDGDRDRD